MNEPIIVDFSAQREVSFFLRLHRHLPDEICGDSPLGACNYREDRVAINAQNDYLEKLQQDPIFVKKEKEVELAVLKKVTKPVSDK